MFSLILLFLALRFSPGDNELCTHTEEKRTKDKKITSSGNPVLISIYQKEDDEDKETGTVLAFFCLHSAFLHDAFSYHLGKCYSWPSL